MLEGTVFRQVGGGPGRAKGCRGCEGPQMSPWVILHCAREESQVWMQRKELAQS